MPQRLLGPLLAALSQTRFASGAQRARQNVAATGYFWLTHPDSCVEGSTGHRKALRAIDTHNALWDAATRIIHEAAPEYRFTGVVVAKNFVSSPHTDRHDIGPQYALSCGDFVGGGHLMVEEPSGEIVTQVDTKNAIACVDGRCPHWVSGYSGTRYSIIWFQTAGDPTPRGDSAVHPPPKPWPQ